MVESNNLMPNIKRWSKQNVPNAAWAAAAASMTVDTDTRAGERAAVPEAASGGCGDVWVVAPVT